jgi:hypothetical protein
MAITTRELSGTGVSTKNAPLTHAELDQNFIDLVQGKLVSLNVSSNISLTNANLYSANVDTASRVPWTLSARTADQLALTGNTVYSTTTVFTDITQIPANTTYTVEESGQLIELVDSKTLIQYDKENDSWNAIDGALGDLAYKNFAEIEPLFTAPTTNLIGTAGAQGFGVGIYPGTLPSGFSPMTGTTDITSDNYGNYQYSDGSVMCWIPKFYYRIGSNASPLYANNSVNAIDIAGINTYSSTQQANAAGFALHRAFIDGGEEKPGFFVDKYECSNNGGIASSLKNGNPLSTSTSNNPISVLNGTPSNTCAGTIDAAKTRGTDFHCISRFQWSALALLATAHGQASTGTTYCAWYSASTTNFPKGNNNNALKDVNDTTVVWQSAGNATYPNCGKTGSAGYGGGEGNVFAKSTHNGQNSGVADLNGNMFETNLGLTCIATSKNIINANTTNPCEINVTSHGYTTGDVIQISSVVGMTELNDKLYTITVTGENTFTLNGIDSSGANTYSSDGIVTKGTFYVAKESTAMKDFTSGNTKTTDHWGSTGVSVMMEPININFATASGANGFAQRYGNSTNQVLEEELSGIGWKLTGLGLPRTGGMSTAGTNMFGADYYYQYIRNDLCLAAGGDWNNTTDAGVWSLNCVSPRSHTVYSVGFRAAYV